MENHKKYCVCLLHFHFFPPSQRIFLLFSVLFNNFRTVALEYPCKIQVNGNLPSIWRKWKSHNRVRPVVHNKSYKMGHYILATDFVWRTYLILEWCKSGLAQLKSVYRLYKEEKADLHLSKLLEGLAWSLTPNLLNTGDQSHLFDFIRQVGSCKEWKQKCLSHDSNAALTHLLFWIEGGLRPYLMLPQHCSASSTVEGIERPEPVRSGSVQPSVCEKDEWVKYPRLLCALQ